MSGEVTIDLDNISGIINNSTTFTDLMLSGIKAQGDLIGIAIGIVISVGLLFGIVFLVLGVIPKILSKVKTYGK